MYVLYFFVCVGARMYVHNRPMHRMCVQYIVYVVYSVMYVCIMYVCMCVYIYTHTHTHLGLQVAIVILISGFRKPQLAPDLLEVHYCFSKDAYAKCQCTSQIFGISQFPIFKTAVSTAEVSRSLL